MITAAIALAYGEFSMDVELTTRSRVVGVFGHSGAGKSTLIHVIAGLETPSRGRIAIGDQILLDTEAGVHVPAHRRRVAVVFQEHRLMPHLSVLGNLRFAAHDDAALLASTVETLELGPLLNRRVRALSGGERQRVAIGRALLSRPRALLLDEPLASLDQRLKRQILPYLRRVIESTGVPVLYVSHDLAEILQLTDELIVLDRGRVTGHGRFGDLMFDTSAHGPLRGGGATNILSSIVHSHGDDGTTAVRIGERQPPILLTIPATDAPIGATLRIAMAPHDIALAIEPSTGISIQNQLRGVVRRIQHSDRATTVELNVGVPLLAEISRASAARLGVTVGREMIALIKSRSVNVL